MVVFNRLLGLGRIALDIVHGVMDEIFQDYLRDWILRVDFKHAS